jgi:hypothetical protein
MEMGHRGIVIVIRVGDCIAVMIMRPCRMTVVIVSDYMLMQFPTRDAGDQQTQHRQQPQSTQPTAAG